jgi:hypothetical protein
MRTSKMVMLIFVFVLVAFFHVFLQTEIIKLGYEVKKNEDRLQELVDNNRVLNYNIYALESPYSLDKHVLLKNSNLKSLKPIQVLGLYSDSDSNYFDKQGNIFFNNPVFLAFKKLLVSNRHKQER